MRVAAEFVRSAAGSADFPSDGTPEIALVGRSNVGKSSLINALVGRALARISAAPGKTRLVNIYRVEAGALPALYLVDLPGYGYARGGAPSAREFDALTRAYFVAADSALEGSGPRPAGSDGGPRRQRTICGIVHVVDARHPGLTNDLDAYRWLQSLQPPTALVATKIDKLSRAQRLRARRELETAFNAPVLPVSAATGEGLDDLWKAIAKLVRPNSRSNPKDSRPLP